MGAYQYLNELWRKKQSDVMRYLLRIRTWEYRQLPVVHRVPRPTRPEKANKLGFQEKPGYVIYRVRIRRGDRRKNAHKGIVYGKPKTQGIYQQKCVLSLRSRAEKRVGHKLEGLRVLNSYWVGEDGMYKYFECIMVDPMLKSIREDPEISWICKTRQTHRELRGTTGAGRKSRGMRSRGGRHHNNHALPSRRGNWIKHQVTHMRKHRKSA